MEEKINGKNESNKLLLDLIEKYNDIFKLYKENKISIDFKRKSNKIYSGFIKHPKFDDVSYKFNISKNRIKIYNSIDENNIIIQKIIGEDYKVYKIKIKNTEEVNYKTIIIFRSDEIYNQVHHSFRYSKEIEIILNNLLLLLLYLVSEIKDDFESYIKKEV